MKIIEVTWRDSNQYITQSGKEDNFEVSVITSVGYLVKEQKDFIVITRDDMGQDDDVRGILVIPKENIVKKRFV